MESPILRALVLLFVVAERLNAQSEDADVTVTLEQGSLKGLRIESVRDRELLAFLGIPYAKPPVGDLRFKAPQPPEPWNGTVDATEEGNVCPQHDMMLGTFTGDEDCLVLNVYTSKLPEPSEELKAVMVWIHGGCYKGGSASSIVYGPDHILTEDVVLVTINYRLGLLGFLSLREVGVPGNNGMKDQVMALRWVQTNIAKFGGDPNRVTIFGESAGGASVHFHLLSPMSKGLFHRAISQSGSALDPWAYAEPDFMRRKAFRVGERMNCRTSDPQQLLRCFQQATAETLVNSTIGEVFSTSDTVVPVRPTREDGAESDGNVFLPGKPETLLASGNFHSVPYITGVNSREAIVYVKDLMSIPSFWDDHRTHIRNVVVDLLNLEDLSVANEVADMAVSYYTAEVNQTLLGKYVDLFSDLGFVLGTQRTLKMQAALSTAPVYSYFFAFDGGLGIAKLALQTQIEGFHRDVVEICPLLGCYAASHVNPLPTFRDALSVPSSRVKNSKKKRNFLDFLTVEDGTDTLSRNVGVSHADELGYLFHTAISPPVSEDSQEMKVLLKMIKMWTNFAKTGDPTPRCDSLLNVKWEPATRTDHVYLSIDTELSMRRDLLKERMHFWEDMLGPGLDHP